MSRTNWIEHHRRIASERFKLMHHVFNSPTLAAITPEATAPAEVPISEQNVARALSARVISARDKIKETY